MTSGLQIRLSIRSVSDTGRASTLRAPAALAALSSSVDPLGGAATQVTTSCKPVGVVSEF